MDPTLSEEAVMGGRLVVGMNIHREICALQMAGGVSILPEQVWNTTMSFSTVAVDVHVKIYLSILFGNFSSNHRKFHVLVCI